MILSVSGLALSFDFKNYYRCSSIFLSRSASKRKENKFEWFRLRLDFLLSYVPSNAYWLNAFIAIYVSLPLITYQPCFISRHFSMLPWWPVCLASAVNWSLSVVHKNERRNCHLLHQHHNLHHFVEKKLLNTFIYFYHLCIW